MSSKSRIRVCGARYQWSNTAISQSAYGVPWRRALARAEARPTCRAAAGSRSSAGRTASSASYVASGSLRRSIVHSRPLNRCRNGACISLCRPAVTAAWLPRPLANLRCRSCAAAAPSMLTPTRTPSSRNNVRYESFKPMPLVWTLASTRTDVPASRLVAVTRREMRSGPASNGSPPCRISATPVIRCLRAWSPIRDAVIFRVLFRHSPGPFPPGLIGHFVHVTVVAGQVTPAVDLDNELTERNRPPAARLQPRDIEGRRPFKPAPRSHKGIKPHGTIVCGYDA